MKSEKLEEDENGARAGEGESHGKEVNLSQGTKLIIFIYFVIYCWDRDGALVGLAQEAEFVLIAFGLVKNPKK